MKYMLNKEFEQLANVRKQIVKFFFSLLAAMAFVPSFAAPTSNAPLTYKGEEQELITPEEGEEYSIDGEIWTKTSPTGKDAKSYTILYREEGSEAAKYESIVVKIDRKPIRVWQKKTSFDYDESLHVPTFSVDEEDVYGEDVTAVAVDGDVEATNAGNYNAIVELDGTAKDNYILKEDYKSWPWTILGENAPIKKEPSGVKGLEYKGDDWELVEPGENEEGIDGVFEYSIDNENGPFVTEIPAKTNAGTYTIYCRFVPENKQYYTTTLPTLSVTIEQKPIEIEWESEETYTYNGQEQGPTAKFKTPSGIIGEDDVDLNTIGKSTDAVYNYEAHAELVGKNSNNYKISESSDATFTYTINPAEITADDFIAPTAKKLVYTGDSLTLVTEGEKKSINGYFVYGLKSGGALSSKIPAGIDADEYIVKYNFKHADKNHLDSKIYEILVKIDKANQVIKLPSAAEKLIENGVSSFDLLSGSATCSGGTMYYSTDNVHWGTTIPTGSEAGTYTVYFKVVGDKNHNDSILTETVTATIYKELDLELTINGWIYGEDANTPSLSGNTGNGAVTYTYYTDEDCANPTTTANGAAGDGKVPSNAGTYYAKAVVEKSGIYLGGEKTASFEIAKANPTVISLPSAAENLIEDGETSFNLITEPATCSGGTMNYSTDKETWDSEIPSTKESGEYTVFFKIEGDENHKDSVLKENVKVIVYKKLNLELALAGWTYGEAAKVPSLSGNSGSATPTYTYYTDKNHETKTGVSNGAEEGGKPSKPGKYYVTVDVKSAGIYTEGHAETSFVISPKTLEVSWDIPSKVTYTGKPQAPKVSLKDKNEKVDEDVVMAVLATDSVTNAGTYNFSAKLDGDNAANYVIDAKTADTTFTIEPKQLTVVWKNTTLLYNSEVESQGPDVDLSGNVGNEKISYTIGGKKKNVGNYTATLTLDEVYAKNYTIAEEDKTHPYEITESEATFTKPTAKTSLVYTGTSLSLINAGESEEGTFTYNVDGGDYDTEIPSKVDANTYKVGYIFKPNDKNMASETGVISVVIAKADAELANPVAYTDLKYSGSSQNLIKNHSVSGGKIEYNVNGEKVLFPAATNAGTYDIEFIFTPDQNHNGATLEPISVSIAKANIDLVVSKADWTYGSEAAETTISGNPAGTTPVYTYYTDKELKNPTTALNGAKEEGGEPSKVLYNSGVKKYYVKAVIDESANYNSAVTKDSFTINQKEVGIEWGEKVFTYKDSEEGQKPNATPTGILSDDDVKLNVDGAQKNAGNGYVANVQSINGLDANNYKLPEVRSTTFSIKKADLTITTLPSPNTLTYNTTKQKLLNAVSVSGGSFVYAYAGVEGAEFTDTIPAAINAGKYKIAYKVVGDQNHNDAKGDTIEVTISKKALDATWGDNVFIYDPIKTYKPSAIVTALNGEVITLKVTGESSEPGNHEAEAELSEADSKNYFISEATKTKDFTIKNAQISKPEIEEHVFSYNGSAITFVEMDPTYTITGDAKATLPGKYYVSITPNIGYEWEDGTKTALKDSFIINKNVITAPVADNRTFTYNGSEQTYTVAANNAYTITGDKQINAGDYKVTIALKDKENSEWKDGSITDIEYDFKIARKIVTVPSVAKTDFTYNGEDFSFDIAENDDYVVSKENATGKNVGSYVRTISLKDQDNYLWEDNTTADTSLTFVINPQVLKLPTVTKTYIYDGNIHKFDVPADTVTPARYKVKKQVASAINTGSYTDTLELVDKTNYKWEGGSSKDTFIVFKITDGKIPVLENIKKTYTYTGDEITFIPEDNAYTIKNGKGTNFGSYTVKVAPSKGYSWDDGSKEGSKDTLVFTIMINKATLAKPKFTTKEFVYNGKEQDFNVPVNKGYEISGITHATEPGSYSDTLTLSSNYIWDDGTDDDEIVTFKITKIVVANPIKDESIFTYNGEVQEYKLTADSVCKISNNKQKNAGTYKVNASLDYAHYEWEDDKTATNKTFDFVISPTKVTEPTAPVKTFTFDGEPKDFVITANDNYVINSRNASATNVGTYDRFVSLKDTINYVWSKGGKSVKKITFEILPVIIEMPTVNKIYDYTGSPITFVPDSIAYTVTNGTKTDANVYEVSVTPNKGYSWTGNTNETRKITVEIKPAHVAKPVIKDTAFVYNGQPQDFGFISNKGYMILGYTEAKEPGDYEVRVILNKNYIWDDESKTEEVFNFVINKIEVAIPAADITKFTYNGKEQTYAIAEDSTYTIDGNVKTNVGKYVVRVELKDPLHYQWADSSTTDKTYDFSISKFKVPTPTAVLSTFIYDGKEKKFEIVENSYSVYYQVADSNASAKKTGTYIRTVSLLDTANCYWNDETTKPKSITFKIGDGTLQIPEVVLEHTYTGDTIVFVPADGAYTLENGAKREVGTYNVTVTPNSGYRWSDSTKTAKVFTVKINPIMVEKPVIATEYTYNKKVIDFKIPANEAYSISGETYGTEVGTYKATITLKSSNYMWSDSSSAKADYIFSINKKMITIPAADTTEYVFNGKRQTYVIAKSSDYQVINNLQTYAGTYDVTLILTDFLHSMWSDSTSELKTYKFEIGKARVELPTATQETFVFDGTTKYFAVTSNDNYDVKSTNASATEVGEYIRTVSLKDTLNYIWSDGTSAPKTVTFNITNGIIDIPEFEKVSTYTGEPVSFVPEKPAYTVENDRQTEAGTYSVFVTLKRGYVWEDKTTETKKFTVVINPAKVEKPTIPTNEVYTYTGDAVGFEIEANKGYSVSGVTKAKEPGIYNSEVTLNPNYIWSDSTEASLKATLTINKVVVEVPIGIDSIFTYNGNVQTYSIPDTVNSYNVSGHHRKNAGTHIVSVVLSDTLHYLWNDSTIETKTFEFNIEKSFVEIPTIGTHSFVFDNNPKGFEISVVDSLVDSIYVINGPRTAINAGLYDRTVSLYDTINYSWADSSITDKVFTYLIAEGTIPDFKDTSVVYTGKTITFVRSDSTYTVSNGTGVNAGTYFVTITPKEGYSWEDGTYTAKLMKAVILPKAISTPKIDSTEFKYNGKEHHFLTSISDSCIVDGDSVATEPGLYIVKIAPDKNYAWEDGSEDEIIYKFRINKILVKIPAADTTKFKFNNEDQEYIIQESSNYTVSGNIQREEGIYKVVVSLNDTTHYAWSDSTVKAKTYKFYIEGRGFDVNNLTQLNDGYIDATPGGLAVLDIDIKNGEVYEYSINCPKCSAFNDTLREFDNETNQIEIMIPDTVKPGIYELTVTLKSGTTEKTSTLKLAVNYPASYIVVCWSNVLMVDNKAGKFSKYQWYKNGEIIKGATSQYYQDTKGVSGSYYCMVDGGLIIGPAHFEGNKPLVLTARVENGGIVADVIGNTKAKIVLMDINGDKLQDKPAGKNVRFEVTHSGIYILYLEGTKQSIKLIVTE